MACATLLVDATGQVPTSTSGEIILTEPWPDTPSYRVHEQCMVQRVPHQAVASRGIPRRPFEFWALEALGILRVAETQRFHPTNGKPTQLLGHKDPGSVSTAEGDLVFPRIDPAIICRVLNESRDAILLGRNRHRPGYWSLIAGYVGLGESFERATAREAREETGYEVENITYVRSQPWPFSGAVMVGMEATAIGDPAGHDRELVEIEWFSPADVPTIALPQPQSIAYQLIQEWLNA